MLGAALSALLAGQEDTGFLGLEVPVESASLGPVGPPVCLLSDLNVVVISIIS